jgi:hypothetical protein
MRVSDPPLHPLDEHVPQDDRDSRGDCEPILYALQLRPHQTFRDHRHRPERRRTSQTSLIRGPKSFQHANTSSCRVRPQESTFRRRCWPRRATTPSRARFTACRVPISCPRVGHDRPGYVGAGNDRSGCMARSAGGVQGGAPPDDPQTLKPHQIALRYRYIARVARAADVCLVIIGQRESKRAPPGTGFIAFSYDLKSHHKTLITKRPLLGWRSLMWTRLEKGLHQELLFEHVSCFECESETYLSSIFLDLNRRAWTLRAWPIPDEPTNIPVGAWSIGFDDASRTTCLFKIANFFGAERALGVWCPEVLEDRREPEERVRLYTITDGEPATRTPDATEVRSMMRVLCRSHSSHVLCRPRP